jgi:hypothetical protein
VRSDGELTGRKADVVEGQLGDPGVELEQQGEGLTNATGGTEDGDLGRLQGNESAVVM